MNIAIATPEFVSEGYFDGGLANYTYKLAKWLLIKGHNVTIFLTSDVSNSFLYEGIKIEKIKLVDYAWLTQYYLKMVKLNFLISPKSRYRFHFKWQAKKINKKILEQHNKQKIDIIHYPHLGGYCFSRSNKIPSIVRLSSSTALCQKMGGYGGSEIKVTEQVRFEMDAMKKADVVFGPSKMIASLTEPLIGKKIEIIETPYMKPEGEIDYSIYENNLKDKKYILFFGSISLIKGVGTIAEIIYPLLKQHQDLFYVFVGKQQNNTINGINLWDYLLNKAGEFSNRVIYIPSQKHNTLFPIIQRAELITLPSRIDNFPNTCIESMANKKIIIGTKGNGFDQLITDGENGFILDVDDHQGLLNRINYVLNLDSKEKNKIEQKALERADKLHPDIVLNQLVNLYIKTINKFNN